MIDKDQLREAIDRMEPHVTVSGRLVIAAARLMADPDTLVISKVDGEWPTSLVEDVAWVLSPQKITPTKDRAYVIAGYPTIAARKVLDAAGYPTIAARKVLDALLEGPHEPA